MKMLTEAEIYNLCKEIKQKTVNYLEDFRESQEKQYQNALKIYQSKFEYYKQALKTYEDNVKREEIEYPKRVAEWEKNEEKRKKDIEQYEQYYEKAIKLYEKALKEYEQEKIDYPERLKAWEESEEKRKKHIEENYEQSVKAYEQAKQKYEATGATYNVPYPQKQTFFPLPKPSMHKNIKPAKPLKRTFIPFSKPIKHSYIKPIEPTPPKKPDEKCSGFNSGFYFPFPIIKLMFNSSFSERAYRQLYKLDLSDTTDKNKAFQIIFREMYLNKRTSTECSQSEGRGISPTLDGLYGEKLTVFELELCIFDGYKGNILHNLEIEVGNRTIQIDVLFITQKGIFVIESKNYSGSISGAEYQNKWTLRTHKKDYHFYNPITQNQAHINTLSKIIQNSRFFSLVVFSERCDLEYIDIHKKDVFVFNRYALHDVIHDVFSNEPDILSAKDVNVITNILRRYCADDFEKNPNYKEPRSYYSAGSKVNEHPNASYNHQKTFRRMNSYFNYNYDDYDDYDDYDYDYYDD